MSTSTSTPFRPNASALITGGASGIGYAVAQLCLSHGMKVTIADFNQETIDMAAKNLGNVSCVKMDVGEREEWKRVKDKVGDVDFLMLNAGVGGKGTWGDEEYFDRILHTNLNGVINGLNAYVPEFQKGDGKGKAIVITGSKQGITNPPGNPAYNASKAAVKALAEHLSWDLKDSGVGVHLLVPGWTFTGLSGNAPGSTKEKPAGAWSAAQVAEYMHNKMSEGKFYIICKTSEKLVYMYRVMCSILS